jgi:hypothetical protein
MGVTPPTITAIDEREGKMTPWTSRQSRAALQLLSLRFSRIMQSRGLAGGELVTLVLARAGYVGYHGFSLCKASSCVGVAPAPQEAGAGGLYPDKDGQTIPRLDHHGNEKRPHCQSPFLPRVDFTVVEAP